MQVEFKNLEVAIRGQQILRGISLKTTENRIVGIIGPNGSGKSTLIKTLFSITAYQKGDILLNGKNIRSINRKSIARQISYIGQETETGFDFTVREIVEMGRYPYKSGSRHISILVKDALDIFGIGHFLNRNIRTLSGGERKLVYLARTVAQETDTIILDEPTNHLDIKHQLLIMKYLKGSGKTVLIVIHDLYLAAKFCDELYLINNGTVFLKGRAEQVLNRDNVKKVFEVDGEVLVQGNESVFSLSYD
ncbi:MAG: ABC transporter ATP-binding protein [Spirochaetaceae bacterium]|jgi:iron complex transport system ATP-binding protein|nr:ABC transporter ATP-binding protein [Spirochaetaceae bacterium]